MQEGDELVSAVRHVSSCMGEQCVATILENPATGRLYTDRHGEGREAVKFLEHRGVLHYW